VPLQYLKNASRIFKRSVGLKLVCFLSFASAIFAVTDMTAVGAWGAARRMGLRIPEDVAIVGYNDIPLASRLVPGLTTVHVPIHEFGSAAARLLLEQIETGDAIRRRVIFNPELIVRGSTVAGTDAPAGLRPIAALATE